MPLSLLHTNFTSSRAKVSSFIIIKEEACCQPMHPLGGWVWGLAV